MSFGCLIFKICATVMQKCSLDRTLNIDHITSAICYPVIYFYTNFQLVWTESRKSYCTTPGVGVGVGIGVGVGGGGVSRMLKFLR